MMMITNKNNNNGDISYSRGGSSFNDGLTDNDYGDSDDDDNYINDDYNDNNINNNQNINYLQ